MILYYCIVFLLLFLSSSIQMKVYGMEEKNPFEKQLEKELEKQQEKYEESQQKPIGMESNKDQRIQRVTKSEKKEKKELDRYIEELKLKDNQKKENIERENQNFESYKKIIEQKIDFLINPEISNEEYFSRGRFIDFNIRFEFNNNEKWFKKIKQCFISCTQLTEFLISAASITDIFIRYGFMKQFDNVGFYTLAENIFLKRYSLTVVQREICEEIIGTKEEWDDMDKVFKIIDVKKKELIEPHLAQKLIQLFLEDCFSRVSVTLQNYLEDSRKKSFFDNVAFNSRATRQEELDYIKNFIYKPAIRGSFRALLLSIWEQNFNQLGETLIENFNHITKIMLPRLTREEQKELHVFFESGIASFSPLLQRDERVERIRKAVQELTIQKMTLQSKLLTTLFFSSVIAFSISFLLKQNQHLLQQYPILFKLFPFLYQIPIQQKPPTFFERLFSRKKEG